MYPVFDHDGINCDAGPSCRVYMPAFMEILSGSNNSTIQAHSTRRRIPWETIAIVSLACVSSKSRGKMWPFKNEIARRFIEAEDSISTLLEVAPSD